MAGARNEPPRGADGRIDWSTVPTKLDRVKAVREAAQREQLESEWLKRAHARALAYRVWKVQGLPALRLFRVKENFPQAYLLAGDYLLQVNRVELLVNIQGFSLKCPDSWGGPRKYTGAWPGDFFVGSERFWGCGTLHAVKCSLRVVPALLLEEAPWAELPMLLEALLCGGIASDWDVGSSDTRALPVGPRDRCWTCMAPAVRNVLWVSSIGRKSSRIVPVCEAHIPKPLEVLVEECLQAYPPVVSD